MLLCLNPVATERKQRLHQVICLTFLKMTLKIVFSLLFCAFLTLAFEGTLENRMLLYLFIFYLIIR